VQSKSTESRELLSTIAAADQPLSILLFDRANILNAWEEIVPLLLITLLTPWPISAGVVLDRVAVIVGKHVVKTSDIDRDLRLTTFLNREPLALNGAARRKAAERLIDQAVIRDEIATGGYQRATDAQASSMLAQIRQNQYGGSDPRFRQALNQYGITEAELQSQLLWQLTVLRFIEERFRPGVLVSDEEMRDYYNQHLAELRRKHPQGNSFEALKPEIQSALEGERINQQFEMWLEGARKRAQIEYREAAFQ
jgi:peptidyl-prolyl cis-trans isomerase SurA